VLAALALAAAAACSDDGSTASTSTASEETSTTLEAVDTAAPQETSTSSSAATSTTSPGTAGATLAGAPRQLPAFAAFTGVALLDDSIPFVGPPTPTSMDDVDMVAFRRELLEDPMYADAM